MSYLSVDSIMKIGGPMGLSVTASTWLGYDWLTGLSKGLTAVTGRRGAGPGAVAPEARVNLLVAFVDVGLAALL